ncbi:MAG: alpha/beta hydrolase [Synechococcaceae cyanobacterium SM2_3_1]|nr:alpha/beta hydrolase [Synechococcaceae cyanobacterium SM2_3_1]
MRKEQRRWPMICSGVITSLGMLFSPVLLTAPAQATERITAFYPPLFERSLTVSALETFAADGVITGELLYYSRFFNERELADFRELLNSRFQVDHVAVSQLANSPIGERFLTNLGRAILTTSPETSLKALRGALILAAAEPEGFSILGFLRALPQEQIRVDLQLSIQAFNAAAALLSTTQDVVASLAQSVSPLESREALLRFSESGGQQWQKTSLQFFNPQRQLQVPVDIYTPLKAEAPPPLVVISHGVASDRNTFAYLGHHLASWGYAVAVLEHPGTSIERFKRFLAGFDTLPTTTEWIDRPLDIRFLLDELQRLTTSDPAWQGRLNPEQVALIGQSLGGYTVLATAGAQLNLDLVSQTCRQDQDLTLNVSLLLQCRARDLARNREQLESLRDPRVKAVIAVNPVTSVVFGEAGLSQLQIPTMLIGGADDVIAPVLPEQIRPFTWLTQPERYLVVTERGTHFSFLGGGGQGIFTVPESLVGPEPAVARTGLTALSTAFLKQYLPDNTDRVEADPSLLVDTRLVLEPFRFDLIETLSTEELESAMAPDL